MDLAFFTTPGKDVKMNKDKNKRLKPSPQHPTPPPETGPITGPSPLPPEVGEQKGKKRVRIKRDS